MSFRPARTRPDILVREAQGKWTWMVHPVVNPLRHRPLAKFSLTQRWMDLAADHNTSPRGVLWRQSVDPSQPWRSSMEKVQANALLAFCPSLKSILNSRLPIGESPYVNPECRVSLRYPADDGRLNFVGHYSDGELLVEGCADASILSDLTWALCPMDRWAHIRSSTPLTDP